MTPHPGPDPTLHGRIDAFLDGEMSAQERAAFEAASAADPALRAELALQRRIDDRIRANFTPPAAPAAGDSATDTRSVVAGRIGVPSWLKVAAVFAIVAIGAWLAVARPWQGLLKPALATRSADAAVKHLVVDEQFKPAWVCDNDEKFLAYTKEKLNVAFLVRPQPGVELVGWTYENGLFADQAQVLLARAEGKEIIVAMARRADDRTQYTDPGSPLHITRNVFEGVVMYEFSTLDHPVVVNAVKRP